MFTSANIQNLMKGKSSVVCRLKSLKKFKSQKNIKVSGCIRESLEQQDVICREGKKQLKNLSRTAIHVKVENSVRVENFSTSFKLFKYSTIQLSKFLIRIFSFCNLIERYTSFTLLIYSYLKQYFARPEPPSPRR